MGVTGLTWQDLAAWSNLTAQYLSPWEYEALSALSEAYAGMLHKASDPETPAPWGEVKAAKPSLPSAKQFAAMARGIQGKSAPV